MLEESVSIRNLSSYHARPDISALLVVRYETGPELADQAMTHVPGLGYSTTGTWVTGTEEINKCIKWAGLI